MPKTLARYIWNISGRDQIWLGLISVSLFLLTMVPLELQRRIINDAVKRHSISTLVVLSLLYLAVALIQGAIKLALNIYRAAVSQKAIRDLRLTFHPASDDSAVAKPDAGEEGVHVSIVVSEVEPIGGFVGMSVSEPVLHGGILVSVFGYMLYIQPWMALVCFGVFLPQLIMVPLLQRTMNRRTKSRIETLRDVSTTVVTTAAGDTEDDATDTYEEKTDRVYDLSMTVARLKFSMNFLMNILQHSGIGGILLVGGWFVIDGRTEVGTVVAFISGLDRINDPWGDLVNYFREMTSARVKYDLIADKVEDASSGDGAPPA